MGIAAPSTELQTHRASKRGMRELTRTIETTAGPMDATELGCTLTHEHLFTFEEAVLVQWPHLFNRDKALKTCIKKATQLREVGVETVCDPSCIGIGRDVRLNVAVTEATGLRFVMATGLYDMSHEELPWTFQGNESVLVDLFVHDITRGIQETEVKAAFIKCAADRPGMVPQIVTLHEMVAEASLQTGAAIMAHSNASAGVGLHQMKLFTDAGIDPARVQIAHVHDTEDLDYIERLLATGCYIGFDRYGYRGPSTKRRNRTLLSLLERGYGDRILLSQDTSLDVGGFDHDETELPNWYPTYLFDSVLDELREDGVPNSQLHAMLGSNVHSWLSGSTPTARDVALS